MRDPVARTSAAVATLAAMALLAAVAAWWGWQAFGPAAVRIVPAAPADPAAAILASGLLSAAGPAAAPAPVKDDAPLATGDTRLLGVFAERDGGGYALFRSPCGRTASRCATPAAREGSRCAAKRRARPCRFRS
jgi:hypothetical protein